MSLGWGQFLGLAVASGAAAGLANQLFRFAHDWIAERRQKAAQTRELDHQAALQQNDLEHQRTSQERDLTHQRDLQQEERDHQAALRRESAFFEARGTLLGNAVAVNAWAEWLFGDLYGPEVDYYGPALPKDAAVKDGPQAVQALAQIAGLHPSHDIRAYARRLAAALEATLFMPDENGNTEPGRGELRDWRNRSKELIEAMHDPGHSPAWDLD